MLDASLLPLQTGRARLRALHPDDAPAFAEGTDDPDVRTYGHLPEPQYTPDSVVAMIDREARPGLERGDLAVLAIADVHDEFTGSLVLFGVTDREAEVGFWVHPKRRGGGVAVAALDLAARFAGRSGLVRLTARTATGNAASQRVLTRAGFTEMGEDTGVAPSGRKVRFLRYQREI
ncbi:GNAT family N-acetyltransferase [Jiangella sp. DSM 45060]|uniref:GNAT family N-acetyltransferase n=1 Tax=Jiangella sp. DSM 45060 TaxID=1798224 RepID=UPI00087C3765|nr:GNAT family N-acetyltransferase [Jiangella sp. DSM 45060]SDS53637.1 Protein N-acetyltransferase, RimJ/RimL family [Jiangella sp. DSM 45060]